MLLLRPTTQGVQGMLRSTASKVMWVGRATVFLVGLAVILALVFGVATTAMGANGQSFLLGRFNAATALTKLTGNVNGAAMQVVNSNADANDTALSLSVQAGEAPMRVNSKARVANLNAATAGRADSAARADNATNAQNADTLDSRDSDSFANATHAHSGEDITSGTVAEARIDGTVARDGEVMPIVKANDGAGSEVDADTIDGQNSTAFLGANAKAADADKLDGKDSTQFFGASTYTYDNRITITGSANSFRTGTASCNSGDKVLSGGFYGLDGTSYIQASYRNGQGWYIQYWDGGSTATDLYVYAVCVDV